MPVVAKVVSWAEVFGSEYGFFLQEGPSAGPEEPKFLLSATLEEGGGSFVFLGPGSCDLC